MQKFDYKYFFGGWEFVRDCLPGLVLFVFVILAPLPWPLGDFAEIAPRIILTTSFFFLLVRPKSLPYSFLFLLGLIADFLQGNPIGLQSLLWIILAWLTLNLRKYVLNKSFLAQWGLLLPILMITLLIEAGLVFLFMSQTQWVNLIFTGVSSWAILPIIAMIFSKLVGVSLAWQKKV